MTSSNHATGGAVDVALDPATYPRLRRILAQHDPMSAGHPGHILTRPQAAGVLPHYLGPTCTRKGIEARGWDVTLNRYLPAGVILVEPAALRISVREYGDLELALEYAHQQRLAARALRATVVEVAGRWFDDLRPFARPATRGATR